jgi:hypothetical protein
MWGMVHPRRTARKCPRPPEWSQAWPPPGHGYGHGLGRFRVHECLQIARDIQAIDCTPSLALSAVMAVECAIYTLEGYRYVRLIGFQYLLEESMILLQVLKT